MELTTKFRAALADRYDLSVPIAEGAMGAVFLASDLRHKRRVAIKVLRPDSGTPLSDVRFAREIRFLANLQHPNILPLLDSGHVEGSLYYVMPYAAGETLRARMDRTGPFAPRDAVRIACQVAAALDYAHRHGVIHRDIKPENMLLSDAHVLLMDFGIARAIGVAAGEQLTAPLTVGPGTPRYMSPEQLIPGQELDGRTDIYSLGVVIFEMVAGEVPFKAEAGRVDMRRVTQSAPRLRSLREDVPEAIDAAVARALAPLPTERFGSALEFANALEATIQTSVAFSSHPDAGSPGPRTSWYARPRGLMWAAVAIGLVVIALVARYGLVR